MRENEARRTKFPKSFKAMTAKEVCRPIVFETFGLWLAAEQEYAPGTAIGYFNALLHNASNRFKGTGDDSIRMFFTCTDSKSSTSEAEWLRKLRNKVWGICFRRMDAAGEDPDHSPTPLYNEDLIPLYMRWSRQGTSDAAMRKLATLSCQQSGGRGSEPGRLREGSLEYDSHFLLTCCDVMQTKNAKLKKICFMTGATKYNDWPLAFGDHLALQKQSQIFEEGVAWWIFPDLSVVSSVTKKISVWIKEAAGEGLNATAGGIRPGAANTLAAVMPTEIAVQTTGHSLEGVSSFHSYLDADVAKCIPGGRVLAGWHAPPWGQLGEAPSPPTLEVLLCEGITLEKLQPVINNLFQIHGASPPSFAAGGRLRPLIETCFATNVLYHEERRSAGEMTSVCMKLEALLRKHLEIADSRTVLIKWGFLIRARFTADNLWLTCMKETSSDAQTAEAVRSVVSMLGNLRQQVSEMQTTMQQQTAEVASLRQALAHATNRAVQARAAASASASASSSADLSPPAAADDAIDADAVDADADAAASPVELVDLSDKSPTQETQASIEEEVPISLILSGIGESDHSRTFSKKDAHEI